MSDSENEAFESADEEEYIEKNENIKAKNSAETPEKGNKKESPSVNKKTTSSANDGWDVDDWDFDADDSIENEKTDSGVGSSAWSDTKESIETKSTENKTVDSQKTTENTHLERPNSWVWKPWSGMVSLISTATEGVTTLSSQVSQGLSTVIESSIGVPNPEEMAKMNAELKNKKPEDGKDQAENAENEEDTVLTSFGSIVTGVTSIGNKVITGGLDTLEGIGKKTMNILQENDPLLLNKRKLLGLETNKPVLSQVLREAKEKSEEYEKNLKEIQKKSYKKQLHFETLFDYYYGLVHLEALEMLSKQSSLKLQSLLEPLTGNARTEMEEILNEVKELCELSDTESDENDGLYSVEELKTKILKSVEDLDVQISFDEILKCWKDKIEWLSSNPEANSKEVYENGLRCLAETCALGIQKMHKIAEILFIKEHHSTANEADALVQLTNVLCFHLNGIANRFGSKLSSFQKSEELSSMITSLFVEVDNSTSYVQSAFQLFIPILQIGAA